MIFDVFRKAPIATKSGFQIGGPGQLESLSAGWSSSSAGVTVSPDVAARFGAVFACVRVRAESLGQLPMNFYQNTPVGKKLATDHPLFNLLHYAPNEAMTAQEFYEWISASLDLRGNAYILINKLPNGKVYELLPLDARWVMPILTVTRDLRYDVMIPGAQVVQYGPDQIMHLKLMSLDGGFTGASIIAHARETVGLGIALEQHGARFFKNSGTPSGVLKTDQVLDDKTYDDLQNSWADSHSGVENAHRVAILEAGLTWQAVGMNLADAQFLEGRKFQRAEIAGLFRVPSHLIGDLERATFNNIEQQGLDFVVHGLMPLLTRIEQRIALQLLTDTDRIKYFAKFNVGSLVRGDMVARSQYYATMIANGVLSPNDVRDLEDMNPREGGDAYLTPMNMLINGKQPPKPEPTPGAEPPKAPPAKQPAPPAQGEKP